MLFNTRAKKNSAFTLAEVLLTLVIVGTVAILTIPQLISSIEESRGKTVLKDSYNIISNTFAKFQNDYGNFGTNVGSPSAYNDLVNEGCGYCHNYQYIMSIFAKYNNYSKACSVTCMGCPWINSSFWVDGNTSSNFVNSGGFGNEQFECWSNLNNGLQTITGGYSHKGLNGNVISNTDTRITTSGMSGLILQNGTCLIYAIFGTTIRMYIDVNCQKGPNVFGKDIFVFVSKQNGNGHVSFIPYSKSGLTCNQNDTSANNTGEVCAAKYLLE